MVILHSYVKQPNGIWCSNLQEDAEKEPCITMNYVYAIFAYVLFICVVACCSLIPIFRQSHVYV